LMATSRPRDEALRRGYCLTDRRPFQAVAAERARAPRQPMALQSRQAAAPLLSRRRGCLTIRQALLPRRARCGAAPMLVRLRMLFASVGQALCNKGLKALACVVPFGEALWDIAADAVAN